MPVLFSLMLILAGGWMALGLVGFFYEWRGRVFGNHRWKVVILGCHTTVVVHVQQRQQPHHLLVNLVLMHQLVPLLLHLFQLASVSVFPSID